MPDPSDRLAHTVLADNLQVRKGESVLIESWTHTLPYIGSFVEEARRLGARPTVLYEDEQAWWGSVQDGKTKGFERLSSAEKSALKGADVYVYFWGPEDRVRVNDLPDKLQERVTGYNEEWYRVAQKAGVRGIRMSLGLATEPTAKKYGIDARWWKKGMLEAGAVPASKLRERGKKVAAALEAGSELHVGHANGTDLTIRLKGVVTRIDSGSVDRAAMRRPYGMLSNSPSGQVIAAVDRAKAHGTFVSNRPVYIGTDVFDGIRWTFEDGRLTEYEAGRGKEVIDREYAKPIKGKDRFSYFSIGLNPKAKGLPPCEDCEEGSFLAGIGGNAGFGGGFQVPFGAATLLGGATVEVDGQPIVEGGKLR